MADEQAVATRSLKPLGVGYLVWHCISKLAILVILMFTTLAYAGIYSVQGQLPQTVSLMGFDVSAWLFIGGSWAILALVTLAGISFAVSALTFQREHVRLTRAIILGRIMFALCVIDLLTSVVQGDSVSIITGSVSLVLTGSLALEVRRASRGIDQDAPQKSFVAEAIDEEPVRLESLSDAAAQGSGPHQATQPSCSSGARFECCMASRRSYRCRLPLALDTLCTGLPRRS